MKADYDNWQNKVREDWNEGIKNWNKGVIKGAWVFLFAMIPIIIVLYILFAFIAPLFPR